MTTDLLVAAATLREALRPRRLVTAALLILLPVAIGLYSRFTANSAWDPSSTYDDLTVSFVFGFTLTILSVVYGTGVIAQELEQKTIVYLLTRPIPRWRLLLAKTVVSVAVIAVISVISEILLAMVVYGPSGISQSGLGLDCLALVIGSAAYGCFFVMMGALLPKPLIYGLLFVFGWETLAPHLPAAFPIMSIMTFLRIVARREIVDSAPSKTGGILAALSQPPSIDISRPVAWAVLIGIALVCLIVSMVAFSVREYVPREDAD